MRSLSNVPFLVRGAIIAVLVVITAACGGGGEDAQPTSRPIALLATSTPPPPTATATPEPAAETLAFLRDGDIWLIGADGENERQLGLTAVQTFSWVSPAELYVVTGDDPPDQFLVDLEGELHELQLPALAPVDVGPSDFIPLGSWSRDGTLYVAPVNDQLIVLRRDGSEVSRLDMTLESNAEVFCAGAPFKPGTPAKVILGLPVFSPDAETVVVAAYCSNADPDANPRNQSAPLYRVSVESGFIEPLGPSINLRYVAAPGFSPDGNRFVQWSTDQFGGCPPANFLSVTDFDNGDVEEVTVPAFEELRQQAAGDIFGGVVGYDWSPDGSALAVAFAAGICDTISPTTLETTLSGLYILKMDGSSEELLVDGAAHSPAWSPSGRHIAYVEGESFLITKPSTLRTLDLSTRDVIDLGPGGQPAWQPQP